MREYNWTTNLLHLKLWYSWIYHDGYKSWKFCPVLWGQKHLFLWSKLRCWAFWNRRHCIKMKKCQTSETPISSKGDCGISRYQEGNIVYSGTPDIMTEYALMAFKAGAWFIGGCCRTTPSHIRPMRDLGIRVYFWKLFLKGIFLNHWGNHEQKQIKKKGLKHNRFKCKNKPLLLSGAKKHKLLKTAKHVKNKKARKNRYARRTRRAKNI